MQEQTAGTANAGVENSGATMYGKPSEENTLKVPDKISANTEVPDEIWLSWLSCLVLAKQTCQRVDLLTLLRGTVGRTSVFNRRTFTVLRSTCSRWVTTYVGKPSAVGQPTRPTQPFILSG